MLGNIVNSALTAHRRYGASNLLVALRSASNTFVAIGLLLLGLDMAAIIIGCAACWLVITLAGFRHVRRHLIPFSLVPRFSWRHFREMFGFGGYMLLAQVAGTVRVSADRGWLTHLLGAASLTPYSVSLGFANRVHGLTAASLNMIFPMVTTLRESGNEEGEVVLYARSYAFGAVLVSAMAVPMAVLSRPFLALWYSPELAASEHVVFSLLVVAYYQLSLCVAPYYALSGRGRARTILMLELAACAVTMIAAPLAISRYGSIGAPIALILGNCAHLPFLGYLYERASRRTGAWWRVPLGAAAGFALTCAVAYPLAGRLVNGWTSLLLFGVALGLVAPALSARIILSRAERAETWGLLRARFRRGERAPA
jgi:O-antigen/teichoic acid export membrane protein